jgi:hypothetical protein
MKKRGLASPDDADALALTFAEPVPEFHQAAGDAVSQIAQARRRFDPYAR